MNNQEMLALLPLMTLSGVILIQMMAIAFSRNLKATVSISIFALLLTALAYIPVRSISPINVTPLLRLDGFAFYFSVIPCYDTESL